MDKHTPGPWSVEEDDESDGCKFIPIETEISSGPNSRLICEVHPSYCDKGGAISETDRANARLIAAAPDLLEALSKIEMTAQRLTNSPNADLRLFAGKVARDARAAISKANGVIHG